MNRLKPQETDTEDGKLQRPYLDPSQVASVWRAGVIWDQDQNQAVNIHMGALLTLAIQNLQELNDRVTWLEAEMVMLREEREQEP